MWRPTQASAQYTRGALAGRMNPADAVIGWIQRGGGQPASVGMFAMREGNPGWHTADTSATWASSRAIVSYKGGVLLCFSAAVTGVRARRSTLLPMHRRAAPRRAGTAPCVQRTFGCSGCGGSSGPLLACSTTGNGPRAAPCGGRQASVNDCARGGVAERAQRGGTQHTRCSSRLPRPLCATRACRRFERSQRRQARAQPAG